MEEKSWDFEEEELLRPGGEELLRPGREELLRPGGEELLRPGREELLRPGGEELSLREELLRPGWTSPSHCSECLQSSCEPLPPPIHRCSALKKPIQIILKTFSL